MTKRSAGGSAPSTASRSPSPEVFPSGEDPPAPSSSPVPQRTGEGDPKGGGGVADAASFAAASGATPQQVADLTRFLEILADWNERMNLVGPKTLPEFWNRHAWDSAQLLRLAPDALTWADLGAGAGFPGLVLAVLGKGRDGFHVHLVESMAKRCRFLAEVVGELSLPATVHNERAENLKLAVDIVTARACAPMVRLLGYARPYLRGQTVGLFLKGQDVAAEMEEASRYWEFQSDVVPSESDPRGRIVRVRSPVRARKA